MVSRKTAVTTPRSSRSRSKLEPRKCDNCNSSFKPKRDTQRFCSKDCRRIARNVERRPRTDEVRKCSYCDKELVGKRVDAKFCNSTCRARASINAKQTINT